MDDDEEDEQPREFARGYPFAVDYFPEALKAQVVCLDVERFDALVAAVLDDWAAHSSSAPAAQVENSLQWVSLVYWCVPQPPRSQRLGGKHRPDDTRTLRVHAPWPRGHSHASSP
jgi:hypothetical protein